MARTEAFNVFFKDGVAEGWVFRVPGAYRNQLDIQYTTIASGQRMAWTQGRPPLYSFDVGHTFHAQAPIRVFGEDTELELRAVQITEARQDELPRSGWVKIKLYYWLHECLFGSGKSNMPQEDFVKFLKTGLCPHQVCIEPIKRDAVLADGTA